MILKFNFYERIVVNTRKVKIKCYACGKDDTNSYGGYWDSSKASDAHYNEMQKEKKIRGIAEEEVFLFTMERPKRLKCLNMDCDLMNIFYCAAKEKGKEGKYYYLGHTEGLLTFDEAKAKYKAEFNKENRVNDDEKLREELSVYNPPAYFNQMKKSREVRKKTIIKKHEQKKKSLEKQKSGYVSKLMAVVKDIEDIDNKLQVMSANDKLAKPK